MHKILSLWSELLWQGAVLVAHVFGPRSRSPRGAALEFAHSAWEAHGRGRYRSAVKWSRVALAVDPTCPDGYLLLGQGLEGTGQPEDAREAYEKGLGHSPLDARLHAALGQLEVARGRFAEAEQALRRALDLKPDQAGWVYGLAQALAGQGREGEAEALVEQHERLVSRDPRLAIVLGDARIRKGDIGRAVTVLEAALAGAPQMAALHHYLAIAYYETGRQEDARREAEVAISLDPLDPLGGNARHLLELIRGETDGRY